MSPWRRLLFGAILVVLAGCGGTPKAPGDTAAGQVNAAGPDATGQPRGAGTEAAAVTRARGRSPGPDFDIAIITLDACRPDTLGCYGCPRATSPELDALAADPDSVRFLNHHVQGAWTKSSVASLFTGVYVHEHGLVYGHEPEGEVGGKKTYRVQAISDAYETIAERLRPMGFTTLGIVKSYHLAAEFGFAQGFDIYLGRDEIHSDEERVTEYLERVGSVRARGGRSFSYVHLNACHNPFEGRDRDPEYMKQNEFPYDEEARRRAGLDFDTADIGRLINKGKLALTPEDSRFARLIYEAKLRGVGKRLVGPLVEGLRASGLYDDTLLIVTADHGEELYDHQGWGHGHALWEEIVHVPLIVKFPRGRRPMELTGPIAHLTQAVDLLPSIVRFAGGAVPQQLPGTDIFSGGSRGWSVSETRHDWALTEGPWKYMDGRAGVRLYRLDEDPAEQRNLASEHPEQVADMKAKVEALFTQYAGQTHAGREFDTTLDPKKEEVLRSLGYLN